MAAPAAPESLAPLIVKEQPSNIQALHEVARNNFKKKTVTNKVEQITKQQGDSFTFQGPLWFMDFNVFSLPGNFPLEGAVKKVMQHFYTERRNPQFEFPAPGLGLELACFRTPITAEDVGSFQRENLDAHFLAWQLSKSSSRKLQTG